MRMDDPVRADENRYQAEVSYEEYIDTMAETTALEADGETIARHIYTERADDMPRIRIHGEDLDAIEALIRAAVDLPDDEALVILRDARKAMRRWLVDCSWFRDEVEQEFGRAK